MNSSNQTNKDASDRGLSLFTSSHNQEGSKSTHDTVKRTESQFKNGTPEKPTKTLSLDKDQQIKVKGKQISVEDATPSILENFRILKKSAQELLGQIRVLKRSNQF